MLHAGAFDDSMTCQYLKVENLIISRTKRTYEVKSFFTSEDVFHKCPLLDLQNKLAKMSQTQPLDFDLIIVSLVFNY